jgi:hypothetical protein
MKLIFFQFHPFSIFLSIKFDIFSFLFLFFIFKIIYEIEIFFSILFSFNFFLSVSFGPYSFNKLENKIKY